MQHLRLLGALALAALLIAVAIEQLLGRRLTPEEVGVTSLVALGASAIVLRWRARKRKKAISDLRDSALW
jgi:hypothetical protein